MEGAVDHVFRARYGETDQMGVIYYAVYIDWFSQGRVAFFREASLPYHETFESKGLHLAVTAVEARYRRPAHFDDLITLRTWVTEFSRTRLAFAYQVRRDGQVLVEGTTQHAYFDEATQRAVDLKKRHPDLWALLEAAASKQPVTD